MGTRLVPMPRMPRGSEGSRRGFGLRDPRSAGELSRGRRLELRGELRELLRVVLQIVAEKVGVVRRARSGQSGAALLARGPPRVELSLRIGRRRLRGRGR